MVQFKKTNPIKEKTKEEKKMAVKENMLQVICDVSWGQQQQQQ